MASGLTINVKPHEGGSVIFLSGEIADDCDFSPIDVSKLKDVTFDFDKVSRINSIGIGRWVQFLEKIDSSANVRFANCPLRIVNQMNLFPGFMGGHKVEVVSFYTPYYCETCDESKTVFLETAKYFPDKANASAPDFNCDECKAELEFDGIEKSYFLFLAR